MTITELTAALAELRDHHGDVEVGLSAAGDTYDDVTAVIVVDPGHVLLIGEG